jgi:ADP-ribose pyrophosphatase YjhB (NUDIX family)
MVMDPDTPDYCPNCGEEMVWREVEGRRRRFCENCATVVYRNPSPTASVVVVDGDRVLLIKRALEPDAGEWGLPAGFLELDESPAEAAARELREETGLSVSPADLDLLDTVTSVGVSGRHVVSLGYVVPRHEVQGRVTAGEEVVDARFWDPDVLNTRPGETLREHDVERVRRAIVEVRGTDGDGRG